MLMTVAKVRKMAW